MANNENLTPFKPGVVHNPNGRPKGRKNVSTYLKQFIEAVDSDELDSKPMKDVLNKLKEAGFDSAAAAIAYELFKIGFDKNAKPEVRIKAITEIIDRLEGKATQKTELTGRDGAALAISNVVEYEESLKGMTVEELKKHNELIENADKLISESKQRNTEENL